MDVSGLGAIICKGTTRWPRTGNRPLRVFETVAGMLNSIGLQNVGVDAVVAQHAPVWSTLGVPIFVNVSGTSVADCCDIVAQLDHVPGIAGIELNISCPNVKEGGIAFGTSGRLASEVTGAVRAATDLPLIVKLSPNVSDIAEIACAVEAAGADAISLINTLYGMAIDSGKRSPTLANVTGGLSGPAIKPLALYMVYAVAGAVSVPIIGLGGIMSAEDAIEFLLAGASAVGLGTALMANPTAWRDVVTGLQVWQSKEGIEHITDVVGTANIAFKGKPAR